jgi:hypothetical protein
VIVAAIFWAWIWGPIGLLLSTPLTLWAVTFARHVKRFEFLEILLSDRPALTPAQRFYEQLLASDVEEAEAEAELLLRRRTLAAYYDEFVLPGLRLAASDIVRGVVAPGQLARLRQAAARLIGDLPARAERHAAVAEAAGLTFACIAGRGPLDDFAAAMLAEVLETCGLASRVVPPPGVKGDLAADLASPSIAVTCLCYLDPSALQTATARQASQAHLRAVIRRLRDLLPDALIVVGFFPAAGAQEDRPDALGADRLVSSLGDALTACLADARRRSAGLRSPESTE